MKTFAYIARDSTGTQKKGTRQSADRGTILRELRAEGLIPVSVTEKASSGAGPSFQTGMWIILAGVAALLLVAGVGFWLLKGGKKPKAATPTQVATVSKPKVPKEQTAKVLPPAQKLPTLYVEKNPKTAESLCPEPTVYPAPTPSAPVPEPSAAQVTEMPTNAVEIRRPFTTGTDQIIAMFANVKLGYAPPPFFNLPMNENVEKMLAKDIALYDDDDEKVVESKENTARMKQELKKYIAEGGKPENFLAYYHAELTKAYDEWKGSQQYVVELLRAGDKQGAEKYVLEQNVKFQERGIREVALPTNLIDPQ